MCRAGKNLITDCESNCWFEKFTNSLLVVNDDGTVFQTQTSDPSMLHMPPSYSPVKKRKGRQQTGGSNNSSANSVLNKITAGNRHDQILSSQLHSHILPTESPLLMPTIQILLLSLSLQTTVVRSSAFSKNVPSMTKIWLVLTTKSPA